MISAHKFKRVENNYAQAMNANQPTLSTKQYLLHSKSTRIFALLLIVFIALAIIIPIVSPFSYETQNVSFANQPMFSRSPVNGAIHFFGTDTLGRDIFVRIFQGARISFLVAFVVALIDCFIGVLYGGIAGLCGGKIDALLMRFVDVINGIPYLIIVLLLMAVLPKGIMTIIIAYAITGWTGIARIIRGQVISLKQRDYVQLSKAMGASNPHIIVHHIIPNLMGIITTSITLDIPNVIFTEAFLSLLGLGIAPPMPSLGILLHQGITNFQIYPMQLFIPALFITLTTLSFNVLGDRITEAYNPRMRG